MAIATEELRGYPAQVYEYLGTIMIEPCTPIPDEWYQWAVTCHQLGLVSISGVSIKDARVMGARNFATMTEKGLAAVMLGPRPPETNQQQPFPATKSKASREDQALAVLVIHPDWTKKQIAADIGCNPKQLAPKRMPRLAKAMAVYRERSLPSGTKDKETRTMEAWDFDPRTG
jgi:hypothetical protein